MAVDPLWLLPRHHDADDALDWRNAHESDVRSLAVSAISAPISSVSTTSVPFLRRSPVSHFSTISVPSVLSVCSALPLLTCLSVYLSVSVDWPDMCARSLL